VTALEEPELRYTVRYGITDIAGVGDSAYEAILAGRPYTSFTDFLERRGTKCNSADIDRLVRIGAFDSLHPDRAKLIAEWEWVKRQSENLCRWRNESHLGVKGLPCTRDWSDVPVELKRDGTPKKNQKGPPSKCTRACWKYEPIEPPDLGSVAPLTESDVRGIEREMLGVYLSSTPFDDLDPKLVEECHRSADLDAASAGQRVMVCVQIESCSTRNDRNGNPMGFLGLLTHDGTKLRAVCFYRKWAQIRIDVYVERLMFGVLSKTDRGWVVEGLMPA